MKTAKGRQTGFSLIEMMLVILVLTIVLAGIFKQIQQAQSRYRVEDQKMDMTQESREFIDQFTRDLHQAGFPGVNQFGGRLDASSSSVAYGIWSLSSTDLAMEADVDGSGIVQEVRYTYDDGSSWTGSGPNPCPCIKRSQIQKVAAWPWASAQASPVYYTEVQGILAITGQPIFTAYTANGSIVTPPLAAPADQTKLQSIKAVRITLTVQGKFRDPDAKKLIQVTMTGMARLPNN